MRWNEDRANAAVADYDPVRSYSSELRVAANQLTQEVFGQHMDENIRLPGQYTGKYLTMFPAHCVLSAV